MGIILDPKAAAANRSSLRTGAYGFEKSMFGFFGILHAIGRLGQRAGYAGGSSAPPGATSSSGSNLSLESVVAAAVSGNLDSTTAAQIADLTGIDLSQPGMAQDIAKELGITIPSSQPSSLPATPGPASSGSGSMLEKPLFGAGATSPVGGGGRLPFGGKTPKL